MHFLKNDLPGPHVPRVAFSSGLNRNSISMITAPNSHRTHTPWLDLFIIQVSLCPAFLCSKTLASDSCHSGWFVLFLCDLMVGSRV